MFLGAEIVTAYKITASVFCSPNADFIVILFLFTSPVLRLDLLKSNLFLLLNMSIENKYVLCMLAFTVLEMQIYNTLLFIYIIGI